MIKTGLFVLAASALVGFNFAPAAASYDFADPKGVSGLTLTIDSELEPVSGHANGVSGMVMFDPMNPEKSTGKISIASKSVFLGSQAMTDAMHQNWALDVAKYPEITFEVKKVDNVKTAKMAGFWSARVTGDFTLHGVTKPLSVDVNVRRLADSIQRRGGMEGVKGDLLAIRSKFSINRKDFGVAANLSESVIGNKVDIQLAFIGVSPKK
ncbi:MAG: YceI family protein [Chthonomonas sp.]|nr:YceI family protein [Chthonomonas sp.]